MQTKAAEGAGRLPNHNTSQTNTSSASKVTQHPAYIRLPKPKERCAWTGLSRGTLNDLILGPHAPVESVVICQEGASRGVRLIKLRSLLDYLETLQKQQKAEEGKGGE